MRVPFERLMELVATLPAEDWELPMGKLAERWGEPVQRIADAIDAVKVLRGEPTYIPVPPEPPVFEHNGMGICNKGRRHEPPCDYGNGI